MVLQFQHIHAISLPKPGREVLSRGQEICPTVAGNLSVWQKDPTAGEMSCDASLCIVAFDEAAATMFVS
jgi:hypothetical protein